MIVDENGNKIFRVKNKIFLKLISEDRARKLGSLCNECEFKTYRDSNKHLHLKTNSYGFNFQFLKVSTTIEKIKLLTNHGNYLFPFSILKEKGQVAFYKNQGFEVQVFLSLDIIENYKL